MFDHVNSIHCEVVDLTNLKENKEYLNHIASSITLTSLNLKFLLGNRILTPKTHQLGGFEGGGKPLLVVDARLGDLNQTTTKNALEKAQKIQQSTKVWLK